MIWGSAVKISQRLVRNGRSIIGHIDRYRTHLLSYARIDAAGAARASFQQKPENVLAPYSMEDIPVPLSCISIQLKNQDVFLQSDVSSSALLVNRSGLALWRLCDGHRPVKGILHMLAWLFDENEANLRADVFVALRDFESSGFLKRLHGDIADERTKPFRTPARPTVYGVGWPFQPNWSSNSTRKPKNFDWTDSREEATVPVTVCIGHEIPNSLEIPGRKIAWLMESPAISKFQGLYDFVETNLDRVLGAFEVIVTPDRSLCEWHPKFQYHSAGSNLPWVPEEQYGIYPKTKLCSMFASSKLLVDGHRVRHEYAKRFKDHLDLFGGACGSPQIGGTRAHPDKESGLFPYMFNIAIENCRESFYYTEKITDCFVTGTVPVYWGSDDIGEIFDTRGIIKLNEEFKMENLNENLYAKMMPYIKNNLQIAENLEGSDDSLFEKFISPHMNHLI